MRGREQEKETRNVLQGHRPAATFSPGSCASEPCCKERISLQLLSATLRDWELPKPKPVGLTRAWYGRLSAQGGVLKRDRDK